MGLVRFGNPERCACLRRLPVTGVSSGCFVRELLPGAVARPKPKPSTENQQQSPPNLNFISHSTSSPSTAYFQSPDLLSTTTIMVSAKGEDWQKYRKEASPENVARWGGLNLTSTVRRRRGRREEDYASYR